MSKARDMAEGDFVKKSGDEMSGALVVQVDGGGCSVRLNSGPSGSSTGFLQTNGALSKVVQYSEAEDKLSIDCFDVDGSYISSPLMIYSDRVVSSIPQSTNDASFTRKDYVDGTFVNKTGDTVTGDLTVAHGSAQIAMGAGINSGIRMLDGAGVIKWNAYYEPSNNQYRVARYDSAGVYIEAPVIIDSAGNVMFKTPKSQSAQGTTVDALTRKDYVDSTVVAAKEALEARVNDLEARIAALEAQVQPALVM